MQIEVNNVTYTYNKKRFDEFEALKGISLKIDKGEFVALVGKTGSGKSTLIQTFNALILPTSGYVKVDDFIVTGDKKLKRQLLKKESKEVQILNKKKAYLLRKKVGMVFQFPEYQLFADTILKDVMFGPLNFKVEENLAKEKSINALKSVGIDESYFERNPFELSGGEKRRVAIAGILASEPDILILDEPTAGLDPNGKKEIMNLIKDIHKEGKTIILVTHDMDVVMDYVDKIFVLNDGKLLEETTPNILFNKENILDYSLEIPTFYKFKNLLKKYGFCKDLSKINEFNELIDIICEDKND